MGASQRNRQRARNVYLLHGLAHAYESQSRCGNPALDRGGRVPVAPRPVLAPAASKKSVPTFSKDVAPIIFKNCAGCHRPGEIAPMSLLTYEEARPWAKAIRDEVGDGTCRRGTRTRRRGPSTTSGC